MRFLVSCLAALVSYSGNSEERKKKEKEIVRANSDIVTIDLESLSATWPLEAVTWPQLTPMAVAATGMAADDIYSGGNTHGCR